jgi:hypothetical protein
MIMISMILFSTGETANQCFNSYISHRLPSKREFNLNAKGLYGGFLAQHRKLRSRDKYSNHLDM